MVATLRGHEASVKSLSLHNSGRFCLAVSSRDAVLWDLDSFARCRTLHGGQEVGVQDVSALLSLPLDKIIPYSRNFRGFQFLWIRDLYHFQGFPKL